MTSKAEAVRRALMELGVDARASDVKERLAREGITVQPQQISNERAKLRKTVGEVSLDDLPVSVIKKVKALVDELGSTAVVRRALDEIDELTDGSR